MHRKSGVVSMKRSLRFFCIVFCERELRCLFFFQFSQPIDDQSRKFNQPLTGC